MPNILWWLGVFHHGPLHHSTPLVVTRWHQPTFRCGISRPLAISPYNAWAPLQPLVATISLPLISHHDISCPPIVSCYSANALIDLSLTSHRGIYCPSIISHYGACALVDLPLMSRYGARVLVDLSVWHSTSCWRSTAASPSLLLYISHSNINIALDLAHSVFHGTTQRDSVTLDVTRTYRQGPTFGYPSADNIVITDSNVTL